MENPPFPLHGRTELVLVSLQKGFGGLEILTNEGLLSKMEIAMTTKISCLVQRAQFR